MKKAYRDLLGTSMDTKKKWLMPLLLFEIIAVTLWLTKDDLFYLLNFSYIGYAMAIGLLLFN
jgi:ferredoxin-type protein NapH